MKPQNYFLVFAFFQTFVFSQMAEPVVANNDILNNLNKVNRTGQTSGYFFNPPRDIEGSYYLFKNWENNAVIVFNNEKTFVLDNINLSVKDNRFETQINKDSVYAFDFYKINYVVINSRKFRAFSSPKDGLNRIFRIFEVIAEKNTFTLLKGYELGVKVNDPDPLMPKPNKDEYFIKRSYFLAKEGNIEKFRLSKKNILDLIGKDNRRAFEKYVNENNLSYKKDEDIGKMLTNFND